MAATWGRKYDVVVWGATGFTGNLVCEYLAKHYSTQGSPEVKRWAVGGRSKTKLEGVVSALGLFFPVDVLVADSSSENALTAMAAQTTVVISTVGPYAQHGAPLVAACVAAGTHYVDLTGEPPFVRSMIDLHHDTAKAKGVKIVHCCGFDSIPSDLGTLVAVDALKKRGLACRSVHNYFGESKGGASGGTLASVLGLFALPLRELAKLKDPFYLNPSAPGGGKLGPTPPGCGDRVFVRFDADSAPGGGWTMPFVMAAPNTRVVRRSAALFAQHGGTSGGYGPRFAYHESMACPKGLAGILAGVALSLGTPLFAALCLFPPTRFLLRLLIERCGLAPGQGPSRELQRTGFFKARLVATAEAAAGDPAATVVVELAGYQDPGYAETAKMLAESALTLVDQADAISGKGGKATGEAGDEGVEGCSYGGGGVLTPAVALGMPLVRRLRAKGMTFRADSADSEPVGKTKAT